MGMPDTVAQTDPSPKGNLPAGAGNAGSDCEREFVGRGVYARDRAISLIECPHRTGTRRRHAVISQLPERASQYCA